MQTAAAYIRVSTDDQLEYSPDAQLSAIKAYCEHNNFVLSNEHTYIDEGISGRKAEKRPAFMRMISTAKLKPKPFDAILVHKFDRFARSREDSVVYKSMLRKDCNIKVISITENIEDDKFSVILEAMLEAMAEYYSLNLSDEVKKGMTQKHSLGQPQTAPPFGYNMIDKKYVINGDEASVVKTIFEKFNDGDSYLSIARYVNSLGVTTKNNKPFQNRNIEYIIRNPVYIGKLRWNPTGKTFRKFDDENLVIVDGEHKAIVSEELYNMVNVRVGAIKEKYGKFSKNFSPEPTHWLTREVKCSNCGGNLVKSSKDYLGCCNYSHQRCDVAHYLNLKKAEKMIISRIKEDFEGNHDLDINVNNIKQTHDFSKNRLVQTNLNSLTQKLERVKIAYENGIDTLEEYVSNKTRITKEIDQIKQLLNGKDEPLKIDKVALQRDFKSKLKKVYLALSSSKVSNTDKQKALNSVLSKIVFNKTAQTLEFFYSINLSQ